MSHESTSSKKPEEQKEQDKEPSLDEIEKELDELRPPPPSPKAKRHMEEEEQKKDHEMKHIQEHHASPAKVEVKSGHEGETHHKANEITPGEPDPTINDNVKIPVLDDHGNIELKPQQGSSFHKNSSNAAKQ